MAAFLLVLQQGLCKQGGFGKAGRRQGQTFGGRLGCGRSQFRQRGGLPGGGGAAEGFQGALPHVAVQGFPDEGVVHQRGHHPREGIGGQGFLEGKKERGHGWVVKGSDSRVVR